MKLTPQQKQALHNATKEYSTKAYKLSVQREQLKEELLVGLSCLRQHSAT